MKGYTQSLLRSAEPASPRQRKMLEAIDRGAKRIDNIVQDLLDMSRLQQGRLNLAPERLDLAALVREVADRTGAMASRHRLVLADCAPAIVLADGGRVEQVIVSLLDNAVKYSPEGGQIDISVTTRDREAVLAVKDRGVGIPREKQKGIFKQFYSAHVSTPHDFGGMGVGLYISNEIITRHGGKMWFESQEGKGSTFYFGLPLSEASALAQAPPPGA